jgi:glycerophosphoryl diester phosphodiesterase
VSPAGAPSGSAAPVTSAPGRPATVAELLTRRIVLAHAGGDDDYPHSTPFAFAESAKAGVDVLDLDVRLSSDGVLVVQHDQDLQRTTNSTDDVAAHTYAELHALDDAYWFNTKCNTCKSRPEADYLYRGIRTGAKPAPPGYTADDFAIPRLRDIAERFPNLPLNIEIKGTMDDGIGVPVATALAAELKALGRDDSTVVTSFDDGVLAAFHQLVPDVALSPGLQATVAWVTAGTPLPDGMRILQIPPEYQGLTVLTPALIAKAKAAGYPLWIWPNGDQYENEAGYRKLFAMGVEGVNASKPAAGVAARG